VTTRWVEAFTSCARYVKATGYVELSRYDACAAPKQATPTICTWIAALGRACAYRDLTINWMNNQLLYEYCTRAGTNVTQCLCTETSLTYRVSVSVVCLCVSSSVRLFVTLSHQISL